MSLRCRDSARTGRRSQFIYARPVDRTASCRTGGLPGCKEFKKLLPKDETPVARNLAKQLAVFATGAPVRFTDREEIEEILHTAGHPLRRAQPCRGNRPK